MTDSPYAILQNTLSLPADYDLTYIDDTLSISQRPIEVTADPQTKVYGESDPALTWQITSGSLAFSDTFSGSLTRDPGEDVADYAINQGSLLLSANYALTYIAQNLSINVRPIDVTADPQTKVYGEDDPALTWQITSGSLVFSDTFSGNLVRDIGEDVGDHAINQGTLSLSTNYEMTFHGDSLSISPHPIEVTADPQNKAYGDPDPSLTWQITSGSLVFGDTFSGELTRDSGEDIGSYAINQGSLALSSNYDLTYVGADLTVDLRPIEVTADPQTKTYGDADPALTWQITSGSLVDEDEFSGELSRDPGEDAGAYAITQGSLTLSGNYDLTYVSNDLTIGLRPIEVTADSQTKIYGNPDPELTYQITAGSLVSGDTFSGELTRLAGENTGSYPITQGSLSLSSNYDLTYVSMNLSINQRHVTVSADAKSKVYGNSDPALSYHLTLGSLVGTDTFSGALSRVAGENVGEHAILQNTLALSYNYDLSFVGANLTITTRPITVTADATSKFYGDTDPSLTYQITSGSLAFSDDFSGGLSRVAGEVVGLYAIQQNTLSLSSNYDLSYVGANFTVAARPIGVSAYPQTKTYGEIDPPLTYHITSGSLVFGDDFTGELARDPGEDVDSYAITQGSLALSSNYDLNYIGDSLVIEERQVDVTAYPQTKTYGDTDPILTYHITAGSLAFSDTFTGELTRDPGEDVGDYVINQGTLGLSSNYVLTFYGNVLSIGVRSIEVTADSQTKNYGDSDPALSYQITSGSLAFSDDFTGALDRDSGEIVGYYSINQGTLDLTPNYDLVYIGDFLTIVTRPVEVTADSLTKVYGDSDPALTYHISSGSLVFSDVFTGELTRDPGEIVGSYAINQGSLGLSSNYDLTYVSEDLTITPRPITITADPKSKFPGQTDPILTYQITSGSLVFGDNFTGSLARDPGEAVGTYAITQGSLALSANYDLIFISADLTIKDWLHVYIPLVKRP